MLSASRVAISCVLIGQKRLIDKVTAAGDERQFAAWQVKPPYSFHNVPRVTTQNKRWGMVRSIQTLGGARHRCLCLSDSVILVRMVMLFCGAGCVSLG